MKDKYLLSVIIMAVVVEKDVGGGGERGFVFDVVWLPNVRDEWVCLRVAALSYKCALNNYTQYNLGEECQRNMDLGYAWIKSQRE